jgi:hypothetical protein
MSFDAGIIGSLSNELDHTAAAVFTAKVASVNSRHTDEGVASIYRFRIPVLAVHRAADNEGHVIDGLVADWIRIK